MRIHKAAILGDCANAVGISVSRQASIAFLLQYGFLQQSNVRLDRLGIDTGKKGIDFLPDRNKRNAALLKDSGKNSPAGAIHRIDGELELSFADQIHVGKTADGGDVG